MKSIPILNIKQFENNNLLDDFYTNDLKNHLEENKNLVYKPHKHDFFLCVLFLQGTGTHEIDFTSYPIYPGSVFFLKPGQTHSWKFTSQPEGYLFFHTQNFYELHYTNRLLYQLPFYYFPKNTPSLLLSPIEVASITHKFKELNIEHQQAQPFQTTKITSLLTSIYIDLARFYIDAKPEKEVSSIRYAETLRKLEKNIEQNYKHEKSAKFYADQLHISAKHLNRIVKTTLGKTTSEFIAERVFLEAKRLIVHSDNSLTNIARQLGYEDYTYFSKLFKIKNNMSPMKFKKKYG